VQIGPINDGAPPPPHRNNAGSGKREARTPDEKESGDRIDISGTARELQNRDPGRLGESEKAGNERLRAIRRRIERGYYNRPGIREKIAARLTEEPEIQAAADRTREPVDDSRTDFSADDARGDTGTVPPGN